MGAVKAVVVGNGSIGRRRAAVLLKMGVAVDTVDPKARADFRDLSEVRGTYDFCVLCTPPTWRRVEQIHQAKKVAAALFVEKPLALDEATLTVIEDAVGATPFQGACNMRFAYPFERWRHAMGLRPWRRVSLVMRQGAHHWSPNHWPVSLALDSIHEIDLAHWLQGEIVGYQGHSDNDACEAVLYHGNGYSVVSMDRTTSPPERYIEFESLLGMTVRVEPVTEGMYHAEMSHFIQCLESNSFSNPLTRVANVCRVALGLAR